MSTCPKRVVCCCRLTARLPSSAFGSRIGLGQWYRDAAVQGTRRRNYSTSASPAARPSGAGDHDGGRRAGTALSHALYRERTDRGNWDNSELRDTLPSFDLTPSTAAHDVVNGTEASPSSCSKDTSRSARRIPIRNVRISNKDRGRNRRRIDLREVGRSGGRLPRLKFQVIYQDRGPGKAPAMRLVPRRVTAAIDRAQNSLKWQGRIISSQSFRHDIKIRLASLFPYVSVPEFWQVAYRSFYSAKFHKKEWKLPKSMELDDLGRRLVHKLEKEGKTSFQSAWESLTTQEKRFQWPRLALWWLQNSPKLTLEFLLATNCQPYPPFAMVVDCMAYIRMFHRGETETSLFRDVLFTCMDPERWPTVGLTQRGVRLYLMSADLDEVSRVFTLMRRRDSHISAPTALCFMNRFTKGGDIDRALDALRLIPLLNEPGFSLDSEQVMRHCCKLLTLDTVEDKDGGRNFKILPKLLELGVRPNRDMMNVVLSNAYKTGDPQLGHDMLIYMRDHGLELDSYTYLTLLKDAVARGDRARVEELMQEINPKEELKKNPYIASKIFHSHFAFTAKQIDSYADPAGVFLSMLDVYSRFYDLTPLKDLRLVSPDYTTIGQGANAKPPPSSVYFMLATYLRCKKDTDRAYRVYRRFRQLAMEGHEMIAPLLQYEQFYNEFLYAFRDDPHALRLCVEIVEDMMHPVPGLVTVGGREVTKAKPSVCTWNLLLSAFIYNRQPQAAEKVKKLMKKHGVEYDDKTWNIIISGYTNAQDVQGTAAAIKEMEAHGYPINSYTLKALRALRDPERIGAVIDELDHRALELAEWEQVAEEKEREELLEQGLRRLAAVKREGKS
ncbi:hypothetical protein VTN77DRAFT_7117 [Rasamsonia byssochlamydoides]|uniref:uncharacterized protein n=1 Tax=Rasamsonia byssochlamydoides TaxID=89139 RepID=UPI003744605B